ncbi:MAG: hypothetical protein AABY45_10645 [Deltaproteobacteria bacterium]
MKKKIPIILILLAIVYLFESSYARLYASERITPYAPENVASEPMTIVYPGDTKKTSKGISKWWYAAAIAVVVIGGAAAASGGGGSGGGSSGGGGGGDGGTINVGW